MSPFRGETVRWSAAGRTGLFPTAEGCGACAEKERMIPMSESVDCVQYKIRLLPEEVNRFVMAASRCDFDVDIAYNRFVVDAKSIVGVFGLDFRYPLTVVCHGYDSRFDNYLKGLALAV